MGRQLSWIDALKGLGILCVVYAHLYTGFWRAFFFLFHMPLFFFIGGYLFRPRASQLAYLKRKTLHLMLPYVVFLTVLYLPGAMDSCLRDTAESSCWPEHVGEMVLGGRELIDGLAVFWFVTCFWATQQFYNLLVSRWPLSRVDWLMGLCLLLGYANQLLMREFWLIGNLNVVLMAMPFLHLGYRARLAGIGFAATWRWLLPAGLVLGLMIAWWGMPALSMDMKYADYGVAPVSPLGALLASVGLAALARRVVALPVLGTLLTTLGRGSMIIMYLHLPLQVWLLHGGVDNRLLIYAISLLLPLLLFRLIGQHPLPRLLLLGERPARADGGQAPRCQQALEHC